MWQDIPGEHHVPFSAPEFLEFKNETQAFENLSAFVGNGFTLTGRGDPTSFVGQMVTPGLFPLLGVNPAIGRAFSSEEGEPGHDHVVLLSYGVWKSNFGGDPNIACQAITFNHESYTVVGVMPAGFEFPSRQYKLWVPAALTGPLFAQHPDAHFLQATTLASNAQV